MYNIVPFDSAKTPCLKCSHPITLHCSLIINISGKESVNLLDFLHRDNPQRKVTCETTSFGWVCPVVPLIQSDCRLLWLSIPMEGINQLDFLHEDNLQRKVAFETTSFCLVWEVVSLIQSDGRILWPLLPVERIKWFREGSTWDYHFFVGCVLLWLWSDPFKNGKN